jgi:hypothetical protein
MLIRYIFACLLAVLPIAAISAHARAEELQDRETIATEVHSLMQAMDFASLDAMAETFRATKARTSSGL